MKITNPYKNIVRILLPCYTFESVFAFFRDPLVWQTRDKTGLDSAWYPQTHCFPNLLHMLLSWKSSLMLFNPTLTHCRLKRFANVPYLLNLRFYITVQIWVGRGPGICNNCWGLNISIEKIKETAFFGERNRVKHGGTNWRVPQKSRVPNVL